MPERRKVATKTTRQGQGQGQKVNPVRLRRVAAQYGVAPAWLRLVAYGALDDPAFVQAIDEANARNLWDALVSPAAQEALARPTRTMEAMGGSRHDVLVLLLQILELRTPENRNFFATRTPVQYLDEIIERELADFRRREPITLREEIETLKPDADAARRSSVGRKIGPQIRAEENEPRVREWRNRVESRDKRRLTAAAMHRVIAAEEEDVTAAAIKKAIQRHKDEHP